MSKELNMEFHANPLEFAKRLPVISHKGQGYKELKTYVNTEEFKGVPGYLRIIAGDLLDKGHHVELQIDYNNPVDRIKQGWLAMYYLPWLVDSSVRTTLRPRSETDSLGQQKQKQIDRFGRISDYQDDPDDPDIFFTAAVNGCMVSVTGALEEPTVFHSNRGTFETETRLGSRDDQRIVKMTDDLRRFREMKPKGFRNMNLREETPRAATAFMYMPIEAEIEREKSLSEQETMKYKAPCGSVFGKRTDGKWSFFYEQLLEYDLFEMQDERELVLDEATQKPKWVNTGKKSPFPKGPLVIHGGPPREFWPGEEGHVLF